MHSCHIVINVLMRSRLMSIHVLTTCKLWIFGEPRLVQYDCCISKQLISFLAIIWKLLANILLSVGNVLIFTLALYIIPYLWVFCRITWLSEGPFFLCIQVNSTRPVWVWWKEGMANRSTRSIKGISISMGTMQEIYLEIRSLWSSHLFEIVQHEVCEFTWTHRNVNTY